MPKKMSMAESLLEGYLTPDQETLAQKGDEKPSERSLFSNDFDFDPRPQMPKKKRADRRRKTWKANQAIRGPKGVTVPQCQTGWKAPTLKRGTVPKGVVLWHSPFTGMWMAEPKRAAKAGKRDYRLYNGLERRQKLLQDRTKAAMDALDIDAQLLEDEAMALEEEARMAAEAAALEAEKEAFVQSHIWDLYFDAARLINELNDLLEARGDPRRYGIHVDLCVD